MSAGMPEDIDRAAIAEHAQRLAEQSALRKVRKALDQMEKDEAALRRNLRRALIVCALLIVIGVWYSWGFMFDGKDSPQQAPMKIPGTLQLQKQ
jgi:hypothetical protein